MKNKWIAALALAGLLLTTGAYAENTPSETGAPVQAEAAAEPQHQLKVTTNSSAKKRQESSAKQSPSSTNVQTSSTRDQPSSPLPTQRSRATAHDMAHRQAAPVRYG